jgi:pyridoxamine 5'-phosphate oxidase
MFVLAMSLEKLREEYTLGGLSEADLDPNPIRQFGLWMDQAVAANILEPNAMTLATAGADGRVSARMVLLKEFDSRGFVFYTSYSSAKARQMAENPYAALVFYWAELERQIRVEGTVSPIPREESEAYFRTRPRGSQLGAHASPQSSVIPDRCWLEHRVAGAADTFATLDVPLPEDWGGYRVNPVLFEFWQGRPCRLHDRLQYRLSAGIWLIERLSP